LLGVAGACGPAARDTGPIRLIALLPGAERRAAGSVDDAIRVEDAGAGPDRQPSVVMRAPARTIWSVRLPHHVWLRTAVALVPDAAGQLGPGVSVRVGIADSRSYEQLLALRVSPPAAGTPFWQPVNIDLGAYSGWQWSLFYRPWTTLWRINFSVDASPGAGVVAWRDPTLQ
jgi:hypothetical protein